jgi:predicted lipid-binding transport protein (Tim44 family)
MGATRAKVVWRDGYMFGCQFEHPIPKAAVSAALLHSDPRRCGHDRAKVEQSLNDQLRAPTAHRGSTRLHVPGRHNRITAVLVAGLVLGGLVYLVLTGGMATLLAMAAVLIFLLVSLLVPWGFWILNNTLDFKL